MGLASAARKKIRNKVKPKTPQKGPLANPEQYTSGSIRNAQKKASGEIQKKQTQLQQQVDKESRDWQGSLSTLSEATKGMESPGGFVPPDAVGQGAGSIHVGDEKMYTYLRAGDKETKRIYNL